MKRDVDHANAALEECYELDGTDCVTLSKILYYYLRHLSRLAIVLNS